LKTLEYTACPLCGSDESGEQLRSRDFLHSHEEFTVVTCRRCGLKYTNPRITESCIGGYYFPGYTSCPSKNTPERALRLVRRAGKRIGDTNREVFAELRSIEARRVIEIGPGSGALLRYLRTRGLDVIGIDTDAGCARTLEDDGIACHHGSLEDAMGQLMPGSFDAVILCHVFEHLYRPRETLDDIRSLLKEEGILYLTLPDSGSMEAKFFGKYWRGLDLPRHVVHYDRPKMEDVLTRSGFEIVKSGSCIFPSSFVESIGFFVLRGRKMPVLLYHLLYYPWKLLSPFHVMLIGSGALRIVARRRHEGDTR